MFNVYFLDVIKNHYMDFVGRANRKQFWLFMLFYYIPAYILGTLAGGEGAFGTVFIILYYLYSVALMLPYLAIAARRLHDTQRSAWWLLLYLLPIIGWLILLVFFILPSKQ